MQLLLKKLYPILSLLLMTHFNVNAQIKIDLQGHRGARGLEPENSLSAFSKALSLEVTTLELDVIISKDSLVVVSHEPFMNHEISLAPDGKAISADQEKSYNLYEMDYQTIKQFDVGSKQHPRFPDQQQMKVYKPLLSEVLRMAEDYKRQRGLPPVRYNIEIKSSEKSDGKYHPSPDRFSELVLAVILDEKIPYDRFTIQSFDVRPLRYLKRHHKNVVLALLVEGEKDYKKAVTALGFTPQIYSPDFHLLDKKSIKNLHKKGMKVIPWTVNEKEDMIKLLEWGVDGFITDYPDRGNEVLESLKIEKLN
ncbi:glycerophosphodiester phosphodiesterase [Limibacter armeniacum]|uniref:glycerophosphodiester phosphodiesterase n=1 Tax=Limibacter armeniacum TaxID=466084 RepID=UPI002FE5FFD2